MMGLKGIEQLAPMLKDLARVMESIHAHLEIQSRELIKMRHELHSSTPLTEAQVNDRIDDYQEMLK